MLPYITPSFPGRIYKDYIYVSLFKELYIYNPSFHEGTLPIINMEWKHG